MRGLFDAVERSSAGRSGYRSGPHGSTADGVLVLPPEPALLHSRPHLAVQEAVENRHKEPLERLQEGVEVDEDNLGQLVVSSRVHKEQHVSDAQQRQ